MSPDIPRDWWRPLASSDKNAEAATDAAFADSTDSKLPFFAMLAFTVILLLAPQQIFPILAPLRIALLVVIVAVSSHIWSRLQRGRPIFDLNAGVVLALLLASWTVLTLPLSFWPGGSLSFLLTTYFKTLLVFFLLATVINSITRLRIISSFLVLIAVPLALTTLGNFASGALVTGSQRVLGYDSSLTQNPNDMALMLNLILPFAIALFLSNQKTLIRVLIAATICLMVAAIVATFSRAGFLTLAVIFLVYAWRLRSRPQRFLAPIVLVMVIASLPLLPDSYVARIETITNIERDDSGSAQTRWSDNLAAVKLLLRQPFIGSGVGMNQFAMNAARGETWTEIHNVYLSLGVELGLPGLLLFLALFRYCFMATGRPGNLMSRQMLSMTYRMNTAGNNTVDLVFLAEGVRVSLIAFSVAAFFHPVAYHFYFYYIAGLAVAIGTICEGKLVTDRTASASTGINHESF